MGRFQASLERVARVSVYLGGTMLLIAAGLVAFEVVARKAFNFSITGADELSGYAYGLSMAWGYAYVLFRRGHIRIDTLYARLPLGVRSVLDVVALSAFSGLIGLLCVRAYGVLADSIALRAMANTPLSTPLWIPQLVWFAGLAFFFVSLAIVLLRSARALVVGDLALVRHLAEVPDVAAAAKAEVGGVAEPSAPSRGAS